MNLNFDQDFDEQKPVLNDGTYQMYIHNAEYKKSKKDGTEYLNVLFRTELGAGAFNIYNIFNKNDQARNIAMAAVKNILLAQGYNKEEFKSLDKFKLLEMLEMGKDLNVQLATDHYNGKAKNVVLKVEPMSGKFKAIKRKIDKEKEDDSDSIPF